MLVGASCTRGPASEGSTEHARRPMSATERAQKPTLQHCAVEQEGGGAQPHRLAARPQTCRKAVQQARRLQTNVYFRTDSIPQTHRTAACVEMQQHCIARCCLKQHFDPCRDVRLNNDSISHQLRTPVQRPTAAARGAGRRWLPAAAPSAGWPAAAAPRRPSPARRQCRRRLHVHI